VTDGRLDRVGGPTIEARTRRDAHDSDDADGLEQPLTTAALVREAIDTALDSLDALDAQARDVARRFRRHSIDEAHARLAELVQSMQTLLKLAAMTATAVGTDVDTVCESNALAIQADTHDALSALIARQLERDWHGLARVIDHSLVRVLAGWRTVFHILDGDPAPGGHAA
jgi:hypothetical protein